MSRAEFEQVFNSFLQKIEGHSAQQKSRLLEGVQGKLNGLIQEVGPAEISTAPNPQAPSPAPSPTAPPTPAKGGADAVTGSRPSSRVAQAPGGKSNIVLGDDGEASRPSTSSGRRGFAGAGASSISFGDDGKDNKTSVKVKHAPGGVSSIQFGDDSTSNAKKAELPAESRPKHHAGRSQLQPTGGKSSDIFGTEQKSVHTSVKTHFAPGGKSSISLGNDTPAASEAPAAEVKRAPGPGTGEELPVEYVNEIKNAIARKGKQKDTFTKFTGNKSKFIFPEDLKTALFGMGFDISEAQAAKLITNCTKKDAKEGMSFSDFIKFQQPS